MIAKALNETQEVDDTHNLKECKHEEAFSDNKQDASDTLEQSKSASKLSSPDILSEENGSKIELNNVDIVGKIVYLASTKICKEFGGNYSNKSFSFWNKLTEDNKEQFKGLKSDSLKKYWRLVERYGDVDSFIQQLEKKREIFVKYETPFLNK